MSIKIGINGFGRIGRLVFRISLNNPDVEVVAINDLTDTKTIAHLLKYDSVHGQLDLPVSSSEGKINVGGKDIDVSAERDPGDIQWGNTGVDIVAECTGIFRDQ
ncbi:MAG: type I glyceraldehyde-3-phosphate dehydrogenase, partial [Desulfobacteraceae bacterium]|nr:type I glyceraldehyde-3-phosphate dehydrogenase [Desulfobacteraceae bacterium]